MQFRIYPDYWEMSAGPEPSLGPIEAEDAKSAYHEARDKGMYPAGVTFGLRAVALDQYGHLSPECGVWGGTQETPAWAAAHAPAPPSRGEEWAVVIVEGRALDMVATSATGAPVLTEEPRRMVGICEVG